MVVTLENYRWRVFDSELHDAIGGEKQSWELSRCWAGFLIVNIAIIFRTLLKYCECPDYIVNIAMIFPTLLNYCEYLDYIVNIAIIFLNTFEILWISWSYCEYCDNISYTFEILWMSWLNCEYCDNISYTFEILWISWLCCAYCDNILNAIPILWILWVFQGYILQRWRDMTRESTFATPRTELVNLRPLRSRCKSSVSWNGKRWSTIMTIIRGLIMK